MSEAAMKAFEALSIRFGVFVRSTVHSDEWYTLKWRAKPCVRL